VKLIEINRSRKYCILLVVLQRYTCGAWTYEHLKCCIMIHLLCVMDTKQLISVVSVLFLLAATVSTRMLVHTECSNYIYYKCKFKFTKRKVMENNFPLSAQFGLFPEHLKEEAGIFYVIGLCCFKTRNPHHRPYQLLCMLHLKFKLCYYQFLLITGASKQHYYSLVKIGSYCGCFKNPNLKDQIFTLYFGKH